MEDEVVLAPQQLRQALDVFPVQEELRGGMIARVGLKVAGVERDIGRLNPTLDVLHEFGLIGDVGQRLAWQLVGFTRHPLPVRAIRLCFWTRRDLNAPARQS